MAEGGDTSSAIQHNITTVVQWSDDRRVGEYSVGGDALRQARHATGIVIFVR
jgi:hypothetical protein